jgi:hypothetical protein
MGDGSGSLAIGSFSPPVPMPNGSLVEVSARQGLGSWELEIPVIPLRVSAQVNQNPFLADPPNQRLKISFMFLSISFQKRYFYPTNYGQ